MERRQEHGSGRGGEGGCCHGGRACTPTGSVVLRIFAPTLVFPIFTAVGFLGWSLFSRGHPSAGNLFLLAAYILLPFIQLSLAGVALGCVRRCWRRRGQLSPWFAGFALFACAVDVLAIAGVCAVIFFSAGAGL